MKITGFFFVKNGRIYVILFIMSFLLLSFGLSETSTYLTDECYFFSSGLSMVKSGDWLTPASEGQLRFQKPILFYWLIALSFKVFGISVFTARLPSVIFATIAILLIWRFSLTLFNDSRGALFSSLILISSPLYFLNGRAATTDMVLTFFIALAMFFFSKSYFGEEKEHFYFILSFIAMGFATLTKGPPGLLIPLISIVVFLAIFGDRKKMRNIFSLWSVPVYLAIVLPWFIAMYSLHGNEFLTPFLSEIMGKPSRSPINFLSNLAYYTGVLFRYFFPFFLFTLLGIFLVKGGENRGKRGFLIIWLGVTFVIFTFFVSKHRSRYLLPLSPALALLTGQYLVEIGKKNVFNNTALKLLISFILISFTVMTLAFAIVTVSIHSFERSAFIYSLLLTAILLIGTLSMRAFYKKHYFFPIPLVIAATMVLTMFILIGGFLPSVLPQPMKKIASAYLEKMKTEGGLIAVGLDRGERALLAVQGKKILDGIYYDIDSLCQHLKTIENRRENISLVISDSEYEKLPERLKEDYPIREKSFTYGRMDFAKTFQAAWQGELRTYLKNYEKQFYLLTGRNS